MVDFWPFQMICITGSAIRAGWRRGRRLERRKEITINNEFGTTVRILRRVKGMSLRSLAKLLGWTPAYVSDIELGRRNPPGDEKVVWAWGKAIGAPDIPALICLAAEGRPRPCGDCPIKDQKEVVTMKKKGGC